jgi:hypothetical protein
MNTYIALWNGKRATVQCDTAYGAQQLAVTEFQKTAGRKRVKGYDVQTFLVELNGEPYIQPTDF